MKLHLLKEYCRTILWTVRGQLIIQNVSAGILRHAVSFMLFSSYTGEKRLLIRVALKKQIP